MDFIHKKNKEFGLWTLIILFLDTTSHAPRFICDAFYPATRMHAAILLQRWLIMSVFLPLFTLVQIVHWVCFILDELFFPQYHRIKIRRPLFVLGPPRSGTTHLHRVLASDVSRFTTLSTWELFLAPSIVQKKCFYAWIKLDRRIGRPLLRSIAFFEQRLLSQTNSMHPSALQAPEEDYFFMSMTLSCSGLLLLFPDSHRLWQYAFFRTSLSETKKQRILGFYRAALQKHLYMTDSKVLLSKNASFNPWLKSLNQLFPDAFFIICIRDPLKTVPSMLSVAQAARRSFGGSPVDRVFKENMIHLMKHHYDSLLKALPAIPSSQWVIVPIQHLHRQLQETVLDIYKKMEFIPIESFMTRLNKLDTESRHYKSTHRYSLDGFDTSKEKIKRDFQFAYALWEDGYMKRTFDKTTTDPPIRRTRKIQEQPCRSAISNDKTEIPAPAVLFKRRNHALQGRIMVLSDAIPDRNGVGTYYRDLVDYLRDRLDQVVMIPAGTNCYFKQRNFSIRMPGDYTQSILFPNVSGIMQRAKEIKPHLIIAPTLGPFGFFAYLLARRYQTKLIVGHHTSYDKLTRLYWSGVRAHVSTHFMESMSRFLMRSADAVVATANEMAEEALRIGAKRAHCVGTTIAKPFFQKDLRPFSGRIKTILYAGRLAAEKNVWALLEAAKACPAQMFLIAGEGPERQSLQISAEKLANVKLLGWLSREQLLEQIDAADVIVLPSHIESFGTVALEGMARQRLVLVSRHCGILEWPELAKGLYRIRQDESVAMALKRIIDDDRVAQKQKITDAYHLTRSLNDRTLNHWLEILHGAGFEAP